MLLVVVIITIDAIQLRYKYMGWIQRKRQHEYNSQRELEKVSRQHLHIINANIGAKRCMVRFDTWQLRFRESSDKYKEFNGGGFSSMAWAVERGWGCHNKDYIVMSPVRITRNDRNNPNNPTQPSNKCTQLHSSSTHHNQLTLIARKYSGVGVIESVTKTDFMATSAVHILFIFS